MACAALQHCSVKCHSAKGEVVEGDIEESTVLPLNRLRCPPLNLTEGDGLERRLSRVCGHVKVGRQRC